MDEYTSPETSLLPPEAFTALNPTTDGTLSTKEPPSGKKLTSSLFLVIVTLSVKSLPEVDELIIVMSFVKNN